jgi:hypothetical protein
MDQVKSMQKEAHFDAETIERLEEQSGFLLKMYAAEFAKDPSSPATKSSRSNMIALRHSINQIYGQAAALEVADSLGSCTDAVPASEQAG